MERWNAGLKSGPFLSVALIMTHRSLHGENELAQVGAEAQRPTLDSGSLSNLRYVLHIKVHVSFSSSLGSCQARGY